MILDYGAIPYILKDQLLPILDGDEGNSSIVGGDFQSDLLNFLTGDNGIAFSDVSFELEGQTIRAHSAILAARSSYFKGLFRSGK